MNLALTPKAKKIYKVSFVVVMISLLTLFLFNDIHYVDAAAKLKTKIDSTGKGIWGFLKDILKIVMVVMFAWAGYSLLFSRSAEGLADLKGRIGIFLGCFILVYGAEWIFDWLASFFK